MDHISERHNIVVSSVSNEPPYLISCHASTQLISVIMYVNVISYSQRVTKLARTLVRDQVLRTVESVPRAMKRMKKEFAKVGYQRPHLVFLKLVFAILYVFSMQTLMSVNVMNRSVRRELIVLMYRESTGVIVSIYDLSISLFILFLHAYSALISFLSPPPSHTLECDKSCKHVCNGPGPSKCAECANGYSRDVAGICKG